MENITEVQKKEILTKIKEIKELFKKTSEDYKERNLISMETNEQIKKFKNFIEEIAINNME